MNDQPFQPPPWIKTYLEFYRSQVVDVQSYILPNKTRWLQWYCSYNPDGKRHCGGLADRLKGMMAALVLSIADNRVILLEEWEASAATGPHPLLGYLEPNFVNWMAQPSNSSSATEFLTFKDDFGGLKSKQQLLLKDDPCTFHQDGFDGVRFTGNLVPRPDNLYEKRCKGIFGIDEHRDRLLSDLFWTLFRFTPRVHAEADRLRGPIIPDHRNYYVAAHIRTGNFSGGTGETDLLRQNTLEDWDQFAHCVQVVTQALQKRCGGDAPPAYLASDNNDAKRYIKTKVNGTKVHAPGVEQFHVDMHLQDHSVQTAEDAAAGYRAVMGELKILMDAACIIISDSGFSKMGRLLSRDVPRCAVPYFKCTNAAKVEAMTAKVTCPT
eukprot:scaffold34599_cov279-Amphora_coffeaeformis.AAC.4